MPIRRIGYACPLCDRAGVTNHLYEATPSLATRCEGNPDHVWTDSTELRIMQPRMLELPKPAAQPMPRLPLNLQVPEHLMKNLQTKYGDQLSEKAIEALQYAAQPSFLFLGADDLERLQELLQQRLNNGSELFGSVFRLSEQITELKTQVKQLQRASQVRSNGTGLLLDLGEELPRALGKAQDSGMPVEDYLGTYLREAVANDWVVV